MRPGLGVLGLLLLLVSMELFFGDMTLSRGLRCLVEVGLVLDIAAPESM